MKTVTGELSPSGIGPLDTRIGGLSGGGCYLVVGSPGPAKMVAAFQFLHEGIARGETALFITNADAESILDVAEAWGAPLRDAWEDGRLQVVGFREDFELRAIRSIAPGEILEELDTLIVGEPDRIAVDPGAMFLTGGVRTVLAAAFASWMRRRQATTMVTFSVDGESAHLPSSAEWLINVTTARLMLRRESDNLYEITYLSALPGQTEESEVSVSVELRGGEGLVKPRGLPTRRDADRAGLDQNRLLMVSLGDAHANDFEAWARRTFDADVVSAPFDAVSSVQSHPDYGCVLLHAQRKQVRDAVQACRAIRPLTRAAIVFASDDAIRSTDRINLLEAGADDCLSGTLDFRELGLRIRQAIETGARPLPAPDEATHAPVLASPMRGPVALERFAAEVQRRAKDPLTSFFCVVSVAGGDGADGGLPDGLAELVRSEEGDLVAASDPCLLLIQGAREAQLGTFLVRLRARVQELTGANGNGNVEVNLLSHPGNSREIEKLLETSVGRVD